MPTEVILGKKSGLLSCSLLAVMGEDYSFTYGNFLYKCKFSLQKENLYPACRKEGEGGPASAVFDVNCL